MQEADQKQRDRYAYKPIIRGDAAGRAAMLWVTRENVRIGRMACTWLIRRFVDPEATIEYLPAAAVEERVAGEGAISFHVRGGEFYHRDRKTPFELILSTYGLD